MSIQNKSTIIGYYNNADKPNEANYTDLIDSCYAGYQSKFITASGNGTWYVPLGNPANTYTLYKIYVFGVGGSGSSIISTITSESASASTSISAMSISEFANTGYSEYFEKSLSATAITTSSLLKIVLSGSTGTWTGGILVLYSVAS